MWPRGTREFRFAGDVGVLAAVARAVPSGDRRRELPLAGDHPVPVHPAGPVGQPLVHVLGKPLDGLRRVEDLVFAHLDEPLLGREDLDRRVTPPALADVAGGLGSVLQGARRVQVSHDRILGLVEGQARVLAGGVGERAVFPEGRPQREVVFGPPVDVLLVPERADHHRPGAKVAVDVVVGEHLDVLAEQRHLDGIADAVGVALVVGVDGDGDAGRKQFRPRRRDVD